MRHQLILIEKINNTFPYYDRLKQENAFTNLSAEEVIAKYCGFEGNLIEYFDDTSNNIADILPEFINKYNKLIYQENHKDFLLLLLIKLGNNIDNILKKHFQFIGYEYGQCSENEIYSSIFHEIIFGCTTELSMFHRQLNHYLLFKAIDSAQIYVKRHHELLLANQDVEEEEFMDIYEVWQILLPKKNIVNKFINTKPEIPQKHITHINNRTPKHWKYGYNHIHIGGMRIRVIDKED
jgi:hypothetical protein